MAYEYIVVGSGRAWTAPEATTFPTPDQTPETASALWIELGEFDGGVQVSHPQTVDEHRVDQETGAVKATRSEEDLMFTVSLAKQTLETMARVINGQTPTDNPAASGVKGYREVGAYRTSAVTLFGFIFEANSPYVDNEKMRFLVPRGYFTGEMGQAFTKNAKVLIPVEFKALVDPNAANDFEKFGTIQAVDAVAL